MEEKKKAADFPPFIVHVIFLMFAECVSVCVSVGVCVCVCFFNIYIYIFSLNYCRVFIFRMTHSCSAANLFGARIPLFSHTFDYAHTENKHLEKHQNKGIEKPEICTYHINWGARFLQYVC